MFGFKLVVSSLPRWVAPLRLPHKHHDSDNTPNYRDRDRKQGQLPRKDNERPDSG